MTTTRAEIIPDKPCRPERQLACSHSSLRALRGRGVQVFECVHGWVDDASIAYEVRHGEDHDLRAPHVADTNRAGRIATIVRAMQRGVVFDPLFLRVHDHAGLPVELHLADGHHRLRAAEWLTVFGGGGPDLRFNVGGSLEAVGRLRTMLGR